MLHLGNLLPLLSADVIARYHRLKDDEVLFVSGSDAHGTPIEVEALRQRTSPKELTERNHQFVSSLLTKWAISLDNYTTTESMVHKRFVQNFHRRIESNGYIFTQETELPFCPRCERFLPDRFVEGSCPYCSSTEARGDQCEKCRRLLDPVKLVDAHCTICGTKPIFRLVTHWYFDLPRFAEQLLEYIENNKQFLDNTRNFSLSFIKEGLKPRSVTRDSKWGVPAPYNGAEGKTLYGWVENILGYISATVEYFKQKDNEDGWKKFWFDKKTKVLCFIGKDNIPFHTIIFPALLLATAESYNLPWNVSTNEWLIFGGKDMSKSRGVGIWIDAALEMFPADYWRYSLMANRPETRDTNFTWRVFIEKVNSDLNDTLGNFIHRTLIFIVNFFDGLVPKPQFLTARDKQVLLFVETIHNKTSSFLGGLNIQDAAREIIELSREGNRYLNEKKPWKTAKTDIQSSANTLYVSVQIVKALAVLLEPFTPLIAKKIQNFLNLPGKIFWEDATELLPVNHKIKKPEPLFYKIKANEKELQKMFDDAISKSRKVTHEEFSRIDLRIGKVIDAEKVTDSKNLVKLTIDIGSNQRKIAVAGIARQYSIEQLKGQQLVVITNLQPRKVFGIQSEVMILAAKDTKSITIIKPEKTVETGAEIC